MRKIVIVGVILLCGRATLAQVTQPYTITVQAPPPPVCTGVSLSNNTVIGGDNANTIVGSVSVQAAQGYNGTITVGGPNASLFRLTNNGRLPADVIVGPANIPVGTYDITLTCGGPDGGGDGGGNPPSTDLLPPERRTTWSPGVTHNGGIPYSGTIRSADRPNRLAVCRTLSPLGGNMDDTPQIQSALDNCAGQVVQLTAGTFKIFSSITNRSSNITLRGAGPGTGASGGIMFPPDGKGATATLQGGGVGTFLVKQNRNDDGNAGLLRLSGTSVNDIQDSTNLAADAVQGTYSLTLVSNPGLQIGNFVLVDEDTCNRPQSDVYWWPNTACGHDSHHWFARMDRSLAQVMEVIGVEGNTITFATPFHHTFTTANLAQLTRYNTPWMTGVGIEDLAVMGGMGGWGNISMTRCAYCWVKHVESYYARGAAITMVENYRSEIRDSYIHEAPDANPGGNGYLLAIDTATSDSLIENNIMWFGNKVVVARGSGGGNVIAYNYMDDALGQTYPNSPEAGANAGHFTTPHMELIEGNWTHEYKADGYWGNSIDITVFRNWITGLRSAHPPLNTYSVPTGGGGRIPYADYGGKTGRNAVDIQAYSYRHNLIGNVLGREDQMLLPAYQNGDWQEAAQTAFTFETLNNFPAAGIVSMWVSGSDQSHQHIDGNWVWVPNTHATILRNGNWDWVTKSQKWLGIGGTETDPKGTPSAIPDSLYLTSKPTFFGANPWPWVNPANGQTTTLPAKARFDAGTPNSVD